MAIQKIALTTGNRVRTLSGQPNLLLRNRYVEENPSLSDGDPCYISRPALKYFKQAGSGPIREIYQPPGAFDESVFVVSGASMYQIKPTSGTATSVLSSVDNTHSNMKISFATIGAIGSISAKVWMCDGTNLFFYTENSPAYGVVTRSGSTAAGYKLEIDGVYYELTTGSVDTGTPTGGSGSPWLVAKSGVSELFTFENIFNAINGTGEEGVDYSTGLTAHPTVVAFNNDNGDFLSVRAREEGGAGNAITTTKTGANWAWGGATLVDGGSSVAFRVSVPFDNGVKSIAQLNNYLIVVPKQFDVSHTKENIQGRFFWIVPGEVDIDPLNYATAEAEADSLIEVLATNDSLWLSGTKTTEVWYPTGDQDLPFSRLKGVVFDRGTVFGSLRQVKENMVLINQSFQVLSVGQSIEQLSSPDIEEKIRKGIKDAQTGTYGMEEVPPLRAWTFCLDGHDYYVIQLVAETIVFDFLVGRWYQWGDSTNALWSAQVGINWETDLTFIQEDATQMNVNPNTKLSNVLVGDKTNGGLYFLAPESALDSNNTGSVTATFSRSVYGQIVHRGPDYIPCDMVYLTGSVGFTQDGGNNTVTLEWSDDRGNTWTSAGNQTVTPSTYETRIDWRSIGSIKEPGRLFRILDTGALVRIDGLDLWVKDQ